MGVFRKLAFNLGLAIGMLTVAAAGTVVLTYLFTGKFPSIEMEEGKPQVELMTADEVVQYVRAQMEKAKQAAETEIEIEGGEVA
jgi:hypothetical protein